MAKFISCGQVVVKLWSSGQQHLSSPSHALQRAALPLKLDDALPLGPAPVVHVDEAPFNVAKDREGEMDEFVRHHRAQVGQLDGALVLGESDAHRTTVEHVTVEGELCLLGGGSEKGEGDSLIHISRWHCSLKDQPRV
jgi:hypothetical protein